MLEIKGDRKTSPTIAKTTLVEEVKEDEEIVVVEELEAMGLLTTTINQFARYVGR